MSFLGHHKIDSLTNAAVCITTSELYGAVVGTFRILLVRLLNAISHVAVRQAVVNQIHLNTHITQSIQMCYVTLATIMLIIGRLENRVFLYPTCT